MNSVLDGAFQNFQISDDLAREHALIREAEMHKCEEHPKGFFKFIRINLLNKNLSTDQIHRFKFVWTVVMFQTTQGMTGASKSEFVERQGCLTFRYDPIIRTHVAYMYDDHKKAMYAEFGQNRDFLASHYEGGDFDIEDEDVVNDIKARLEVLKANLKPVVNPEGEPISAEEVAKINDADLDDELKRIEEMKARILERKRQKVKIQDDTGNVPRETTGKLQAQPKTEAQQKAPKAGKGARKARVPLATEA